MASTILNKINKVLRLTQSDNVHEAANALARAQAMAEKYNIGLELLADSGRSYGQDRIVFYSDEYGEPWVVQPLTWESVLAKVVSDHNNCRVISRVEDGTETLEIIGLLVDMEITSSMFFWLKSEMQRLMLSQAGKSKAEIDSFLLGAVYTIHRRLHESKEEARYSLSGIRNVQNAITKIDGRQSMIDEKLRGRKLSSRQVRSINDEAWYRGANRAYEINIHPRNVLNGGS